MDFKIIILSTFLLIAVALLQTAEADYDDYHPMAMCDNRCEYKNRLNPFADSCDECCRMRGFKKGKCKGFGWAYCMCKPHSQIRQILTSMFHNQLNG